VSVLSHHQVINAGPNDRHKKAHDSLPVFLSNYVHNQIILKIYSNDYCPRPQFRFLSRFWPKLATHFRFWFRFRPKLLKPVSVDLYSCTVDIVFEPASAQTTATDKQCRIYPWHPEVTGYSVVRLLAHYKLSLMQKRVYITRDQHIVT